MGQDSKNSKIENSRIWNLAGLGTEFTVIVLASIYAGNWIDGYFLSAPLGLLSGLVFAMVFGVYYLIHRTKNA